jgi:hypothetical protein
MRQKVMANKTKSPDVGRYRPKYDSVIPKSFALRFPKCHDKYRPKTRHPSAKPRI